MKKYSTKLGALLSFTFILFGVTYTLISLKAKANSEDFRSYLVRTNAILTNVPYLEDQDRIDLARLNPSDVMRKLSSYRELRYNATFPTEQNENQLPNALKLSIPIRVRSCIRLHALDYGTILIQREAKHLFSIVNVRDKNSQNVRVTILESKNCSIVEKFDLFQFSNGVIKLKLLLLIPDEDETGRMAIRADKVLFMSRTAKLSKMSFNGAIDKVKRILPINLFSSTQFDHSGVKSILVKNGRIYFAAAIVEKDCALLRIYSVNEVSFGDLRTHYSSRCFRNNRSLGGDNYTELNAVGGRIIDDPRNADRIIFSLGNPEIWQGDENPNQATPLGLVVELNPETNKTMIYSKGHRNVQGMCFAENELYASEQGPQGGDELNYLDYRKDYGWPNWSYGRPYGVGETTKFGREYGLHESKHSTKPLYAWSPSIAIGAIECAKLHQNSEDFNIVAATLKDESLRLMTIFRKRVLIDERIFLGKRIREILIDEKMQDGYLMTDENEIYQLIFQSW